MVNKFCEESLENPLIRAFQNVNIQKNFVSEYLEKIFIFDILKCMRMKDFEEFLDKISSPWLKKILNIDVLKCTRIKDFQDFLHEISSPWLMKILNFDVLKCTRIKNF